MSVTLERHDAVGVITLERPPANAFDEQQTQRLAEAVARSGADPDIRALLIRGAGRRFCGGADALPVGAASRMRARRAPRARLADGWQPVCAARAELPTPSLAAIAGAATGGGLELALACDFRIVGARAKVGLPEIALGLLPGAGGTQRLTRLAGPATATRLILGAELIDGLEAQRLGVAHWVVDDADVDVEGLRHAHRLSELPTDAYAAAKRCIISADGPDGYAVEVDEISQLIDTDETLRLLGRFVARAR